MKSLSFCGPAARWAGLAFVLFAFARVAPSLRAAGAAVDDQAPRFASPDDAVKALVQAAKAGDQAAVNAIFGPRIKELLSGDAKQDQIEFASFAKAVAQICTPVAKGDDEVVLDIGANNWPMPIPLVKKGGQWAFDPVAGKEEVLNRRIGRDEITAIGVCQTYVEAQREYASDDRDGSGVLKYAQKLRSTPGKRDGLYWKAGAEEDLSPFGPLVAQARAEGYGRRTSEGQPQPFHGYLFKILTAQGPAAPGGPYSYLINGNMIAGFALVAYPAHWGDSGVMTFIVNQFGKVYQANLGDKSAEIASAMTEFNPNGDWTLVGQ